MKEYTEALEVCVNSPNLAERHRKLIHLIEQLIPALNDEIGPIGGGAIREIMALQQECKDHLPEESVPFSWEEDDHNTYLNLTLGKIAGNNSKTYDFGIRAETPWHNDWAYFG